MKIVYYLLGLIDGEDGKISLKSVLAIFTFVGLIKYVEVHDARRMEPSSDVMYAFITLIVMLLGLRVTQNIASLLTNKPNQQ